MLNKTVGSFFAHEGGKYSQVAFGADSYVGREESSSTTCQMILESNLEVLTYI